MMAGDTDRISKVREVGQSNKKIVTVEIHE